MKENWARSVVFALLGSLLLHWLARCAATALAPDPRIFRLYHTCMTSEPGSSLERLKKLFGEPISVEERDASTTVYLFGDDEYDLQFSDRIRAKQDKPAGRISSLSCAEREVTWRVPASS